MDLKIGDRVRAPSGNQYTVVEIFYSKGTISRVLLERNSGHKDMVRVSWMTKQGWTKVLRT